MEKQAQFDALTELPNRFYMMAKLKNLFEADKQGEYFLAMIDIDDFKKINDSFGHNVGDDALKMLARTIVNKVEVLSLAIADGEEKSFYFLVNVSTERCLRIFSMSFV